MTLNCDTIPAFFFVNAGTIGIKIPISIMTTYLVFAPPSFQNMTNGLSGDTLTAEGHSSSSIYFA